MPCPICPRSHIVAPRWTPQVRSQAAETSHTNPWADPWKTWWDSQTAQTAVETGCFWSEIMRLRGAKNEPPQKYQNMKDEMRMSWLCILDTPRCPLFRLIPTLEWLHIPGSLLYWVYLWLKESSAQAYSRSPKSRSEAWWLTGNHFLLFFLSWNITMFYHVEWIKHWTKWAMA